MKGDVAWRPGGGCKKRLEVYGHGTASAGLILQLGVPAQIYSRSWFEFEALGWHWDDLRWESVDNGLLPAFWGFMFESEYFICPLAKPAFKASSCHFLWIQEWVAYKVVWIWHIDWTFIYFIYCIVIYWPTNGISYCSDTAREKGEVISR